MALRITASPFRGRHWALTTTALRLLPVGYKTKTEQKRKSEPKYKVGQIVYFYKNDELVESKIIIIDSIGLKIEYTDVLKDKTKTKFIAFDKVLLEKP